MSGPPMGGDKLRIPSLTTERYIGSKQKLQDAVNDRFEILVAKYVP